MGADRQLKQCVESFWAGNIDEKSLTQSCRSIMTQHWIVQRDHKIDIIPSNDFSLYDHVLDHCLLFNVIPTRYQPVRQRYHATVNLNNNINTPNVPFDYETYFAMARGAQKQQNLDGDGNPHHLQIDVSALQMKKWFDTNYHYSVPEFGVNQEFSLSPYVKPLHDWMVAKQIGVDTRPVIIGPVSFLMLGKWQKEKKDHHFENDSSHCSDDSDGVSLLRLLPSLVPVYRQLLVELSNAGVTRVQFDEPMLVTDEASLPQVIAAYRLAYSILNQLNTGIHVTCATYFGSIKERVLSELLTLPINGIHVDIVRGGCNYLNTVVECILSRPHSNTDSVVPPVPFEVSLGVVDGRNVWLADLTTIHHDISQYVQKPLTPLIANGSIQLICAPSCSLLHVPFSKDAETIINPQIKTWLSFGIEKLTEIGAVSVLLSGSAPSVVSLLLASNRRDVASRATSPLIHRDDAQQQINKLHQDEQTRIYYRRKSAFPQRYLQQQLKFNLPVLPTTTIGSFPQTGEVRRARAQYRRDGISSSEYLSLIHKWTRECLALQEQIGLDVLVHGEFERTDMVEFFAQFLTGYVMTQNGWVQSYGSRCVKPPILYGDVSRICPMTVDLAVFAQSCTSKPVKGMLTGPVTCLQWSFVRDDIPRKITCQQLAMAIRQEVQDLERAGIGMIQIDEPALREGLPINSVDRVEYVKWSVDCFLVASCGVEDTTQIHTHMCYSDFKHIIHEIIRLDADVITIEHSRSDESLLHIFAEHAHNGGGGGGGGGDGGDARTSTNPGYPNSIGPGVYDIHTPLIPSVDEMLSRIERFIKYLPLHHVWVNPDCGLKTRTQQQVVQALHNMVQATTLARNIISNKQASRDGQFNS